MVPRAGMPPLPPSARERGRQEQRRQRGQQQRQQRRIAGIPGQQRLRPRSRLPRREGAAARQAPQRSGRAEQSAGVSFRGVLPRSVRPGAGTGVPEGMLRRGREGLRSPCARRVDRRGEVSRLPLEEFGDGRGRVRAGGERGERAHRTAPQIDEFAVYRSRGSQCCGGRGWGGGPDSRDGRRIGDAEHAAMHATTPHRIETGSQIEASGAVAVRTLPQGGGNVARGAHSLLPAGIHAHHDLGTIQQTVQL
mmetsp:Transcript_40357/g.84756  ORF Transcript_40357/g.84756 Transcript_40357/m.84756 type:complete len:250 (-) Transcript_40357:296-1045(-)